MYQRKSCPSTDFLERRSRDRRLLLDDMPACIKHGLNEVQLKIELKLR